MSQVVCESGKICYDLNLELRLEGVRGQDLWSQKVFKGGLCEEGIKNHCHLQL